MQAWGARQAAPPGWQHRAPVLCQSIARLPPAALPAPRSPPTIAATAPDGDTIEVTVTAPAEGQPWTSYALTLCTVEGGAVTTTCLSHLCLAITTGDPATANPDTTCTVTGVTAGTTYHITAVATKAGESTPPSDFKEVMPLWP